MGATALAMTVTDPSAFKSGRELAAWIGLVPRQNSTGGKTRLGGISKQGDRYLRRLLIVGAAAVIRYAETHPEKHPWLIRILARKPRKVAAAALTDKASSSSEAMGQKKIARIVWVLLVKGGAYRAPSLAAAA